MKVRSDVSVLVFTESDHELRIQYSNRGEPFRDGVECGFYHRDGVAFPAVRVLLNHEEVEQLRDKLTEFLGDEKGDTND